MSDSFVTPWIVTHQASLFLWFPRQEYLSGLPFPSRGYLLNPGTETASPSLADRFFNHWTNWKSDMCTCMLSHFSHVQLFATLCTIACQAPLPMGFSRQEYWSGLPVPSPGVLPNPGIKPGSPALQADSLPLCTWEALKQLLIGINWRG